MSAVSDSILKGSSGPQSMGVDGVESGVVSGVVWGVVSGVWVSTGAGGGGLGGAAGGWQPTATSTQMLPPSRGLAANMFASRVPLCIRLSAGEGSAVVASGCYRGAEAEMSLLFVMATAAMAGQKSIASLALSVPEGGL